MKNNEIKFVLSVFYSKGICDDTQKRMLDPDFDRLSNAGLYTWCSQHCPLFQNYLRKELDSWCFMNTAFKSTFAYMSEHKEDFIGELL